MTPVIKDVLEDDIGRPTRWTFGTLGVRDGRFGGAYPNGHVRLNGFGTTPEGGQVLMPPRVVKCASYRKAVRKLRQWLNGYNV